MRQHFEVRVAGPARRDIASIVKWSFHEFGARAALRYEALISQALRDIAADPDLPGSRKEPKIMIEGARTYHLSFSRRRVGGPGVKEPRHFLLYRRIDERVIEVARILHDARDLDRHLPEGYRRVPPGGR